VAITRFGEDPVSGSGVIGTVNLIIVEDLIDLLPAPDDTISTWVGVEDILAIGAGYEPIPVFTDSIHLRMYHFDATPTRNDDKAYPPFALYPNPSTGKLFLRCAEVFDRLELIDPAGRNYLLYDGIPLKDHEIRLPAALPRGYYWLRVTGAQFRIVRNIALVASP
jgi:hypothetical protein